MAIRTVNRMRMLVRRARFSALTVPPGLRPRYRRDITQLGIVRTFGALEAYLTDHADTIMRRELPVPANPTGIIAFVHMQTLASFRGSMSRPLDYWRDALGVDPRSHTNWARIDEYRHLRNVITHAVGYVRAGGSRLPKPIEKRITAITSSPARYSGEVPMTDSDFEECANLVVDIVRWLDDARA